MRSYFCVCGCRYFYEGKMTLPERLGFAIGWLKPHKGDLIVMDVDELVSAETEEQFMERQFAELNRRQVNA